MLVMPPATSDASRRVRNEAYSVKQRSAVASALTFLLLVITMGAVGKSAQPPRLEVAPSEHSPHLKTPIRAWNSASHSNHSVKPQTHVRLGRHHISHRVLQLENASEATPTVVPQSTLANEESIGPMDYNPSATQTTTDNEDSTVARMTTTMVVSILLVVTSGTIVFCTMLLHIQDLLDTCARCFQGQRRKSTDDETPDLNNSSSPPLCHDEDNSDDDDSGNALFTIRKEEEVSCVSRVSSMTENSAERVESQHDDDSKKTEESEQPPEVAASDITERDQEIEADQDREDPPSSVEDSSGWLSTNGSLTDSSLDKSYETGAGCLLNGDNKISAGATFCGTEQAETKATCVARKSTPHSIKSVLGEQLAEIRDTVPSNREDERDKALRANVDEYFETRDAPNHETEQGDYYIRDVYYYVPMDGRMQDLGVEVQDALDPTEYPRIVGIDPFSPLQSRLFVGDVILSRNGRDAAGWSARHVLSGDELTIHFTILSCVSDSCSSDEETTDISKSVTSGPWLASTAMEV